MSQLASGTAAGEYQSTIASARYFGLRRRKPNRKTLQGDPDDGAPQADSTPDIPAPFKRDQFLIWFIHGPAEKDTSVRCRFGKAYWNPAKSWEPTLQ